MTPMTGGVKQLKPTTRKLHNLNSIAGIRTEFVHLWFHVTCCCLCMLPPILREACDAMARQARSTAHATIATSACL